MYNHSILRERYLKLAGKININNLIDL